MAVNLIITMIMLLVESKYRGRHRHPIKFYPIACAQYIILVIDINKHMCVSVLEWSQLHELGAQLALKRGSLTTYRAHIDRLCEMNSGSLIAL